MMVADGMGGHRAGEIASSMVVTHLGSRFASLSTIGTKFDAVNWLNENINTINMNDSLFEMKDGKYYCKFCNKQCYVEKTNDL